MAITIKDVAAQSGVSISTVSKVLNHNPVISEATRTKVQSVINELGYVPNSRAISFAKKSTKNVAFLTSLEKENAYKNPHMFDIMCGAYKEISKYGYSLSLIDISTESYPCEAVMRVITEGNFSGIIVHGSAINEATADYILKKNFPHTVIASPDFQNQLCWIDTNQQLCGQYAADHLISCGYKRIAFIGERKTDFISQERLKGVRTALSKIGRRMDKDYIINIGSSASNCTDAMNQLLSLTDRPDAIICENNTIALEVSRQLEKAGISVPDEMAFLTFDRYPYSNIITPTPTIIDIDVYDMGVQAANTLVRKFENPDLFVQSFTTLPILIKGKTT